MGFPFPLGWERKSARDLDFVWVLVLKGGFVFHYRMDGTGTKVK